MGSIESSEPTLIVVPSLPARTTSFKPFPLPPDFFYFIQPTNQAFSVIVQTLFHFDTLASSCLITVWYCLLEVKLFCKSQTRPCILRKPDDFGRPLLATASFLAQVVLKIIHFFELLASLPTFSLLSPIFTMAYYSPSFSQHHASSDIMAHSWRSHVVAADPVYSLEKQTTLRLAVIADFYR